MKYLFSLVLSLLAAATTAVAESPEFFPLPNSGLGPLRPLIAELDGNTANGREIVVSTSDGAVHALSSAGTILWSATTPNVSCTAAPGNDKVYSSPVVGDLFGTGEMYVVVGYGGFRGQVCDGGIVALRGTTGEQAWNFSIKKWAKTEQFYAFRNAVYGTPALSDVDGDGTLEIGFGSFDRNVYLLNANGSVRWYYNAADTVFSTPAFADVTNSPGKEMIIGTDISRNPRLKPPTRDGGYVYALKAATTVPPGTKFTFRSSELQGWRASFNQVIQASPVIDDLIPQSPGLEIVIGSGCFFPQGGGDRRGKWYKVLSASTGKTLRTLRVTACTPTTPAVGDLDNDGVKEVVVPVSGTSAAGGNGTSHLIAWRPANNQILWDITPKVGRGSDSYGGHSNRTPVIVDLTGDGVKEVVINQRSGVVVVDGATGAHLTCDSRGCSKPLLKTDASLQGSPAVGDTNGDGILEIVVLGRLRQQNGIIRWNNPF